MPEAASTVTTSSAEQMMLELVQHRTATGLIQQQALQQQEL